MDPEEQARSGQSVTIQLNFNNGQIMDSSNNAQMNVKKNKFTGLVLSHENPIQEILNSDGPEDPMFSETF